MRFVVLILSFLIISCRELPFSDFAPNPSPSQDSSSGEQVDYPELPEPEPSGGESNVGEESSEPEPSGGESNVGGESSESERAVVQIPPTYPVQHLKGVSE